MSEITVSRPEVVNENTDVICSTSVRSRSLEYDNFPEISEANILSTF
ncbi:restriction endonuclease subunit M, partial [Escherichia coli]|nr:restriction endonuclease subunit M [Escherichia coli]EJA4554955.1 restriction endonuclease subunit M [Escherichia coli]EKR6440685.1 restriction endonuclease subunit M [Escherichia coli]HBB8393748.1 restriction endonuclease subunit M [Escherichia coli]HCK1342346.1 restriction endonuclease subunit M [Escherichia coli]